MAKLNFLVVIGDEAFSKTVRSALEHVDATIIDAGRAEDVLMRPHNIKSTILQANTPRTPTLRAAFGTSVGSPGKWNLLMPRGTYHGANLAPIGGSIVIDDAMLQDLVANWQAAGRPPLPIRKTHQHLDETPSAVERLELEKAYGFLTDMRVTAAGLEVMTEWNAAGKATVEGGEFAFWSPEWHPKHKDRRTGEMKGWWLSGTALTNDPFFNEMPPVAASADDAETTDNPNKEPHMFTAEQMTKMKAALGVSAECSGDEFYAAFEKKMAPPAPGDAPVDVQAAVTASLKSVRAEYDGQLKAANDTIAAMKAEALERDVEAAAEKAKLGDGKRGRAIPDAIVASAKSLAKHGGLKAAVDLFEALPLTVPTAPVGVDGKAVASAADDRATYARALDDKMKAGMKASTAAAAVAAENRDLVARLFPRS